MQCNSAQNVFCISVIMLIESHDIYKDFWGTKHIFHALLKQTNVLKLTKTIFRSWPKVNPGGYSHPILRYTFCCLVWLLLTLKAFKRSHPPRSSTSSHRSRFGVMGLIKRFMAANLLGKLTFLLILVSVDDDYMHYPHPVKSQLVVL